MIDRARITLQHVVHNYGLIETVVDLIDYNPAEMDRINAGCLADLLRYPGNEVARGLEELDMLLFDLERSGGPNRVSD